MAELLLEKETIFSEDIESILGSAAQHSDNDNIENSDNNNDGSDQNDTIAEPTEPTEHDGTVEGSDGGHDSEN
jgi:hypothetical protein